MGLTLNTDIDKLMESINSQVASSIDQVIEAMFLAATAVVGEARRLSTYTDRTGNLRSSIGFVVFDHGKKKYESFEAHPFGESGTDGVAKAKELAESVASEYGDQIVTVMVAGMHYAAYVESKGFDVISGPWLGFQKYFESYMH